MFSKKIVAKFVGTLVLVFLRLRDCGTGSSV
jgi:hypothetical protein